MSEAKRCDRCNGYYTINEDIEKRGEYPTPSDFKKFVYSMSLYDNNVNRIRHLDLCPECSSSLMAWFKLTTVKQHVEAEETEKDKETLNIANCKNSCDICKYKDVPAEYEPCRSCGELNNFEPKEDSE